MRLLVTRPEPDGERTAAKLRALGHDVVLAPLLQIEFLRDAVIDAGPWQAVAMTSAHAAAALREIPHGPELCKLRAYVVGRRTAMAARAAGFEDVISADGGIDELSHLISQQHPAGATLLYLAGEDRSGDLGGDLARFGIPATTVVTYRAVPAASLPASAQRALMAGTLDGALHFSRRSTDSYLACAQAAVIRDKALNILHFCLSRQVAEPLERAGASRVRVAPRPEEAALIALLAEPLT